MAQTKNQTKNQAKTVTKNAAKKAVKTPAKISAKAKLTAAKPAAMLRKGALAYIGLYGAAYETAKSRFETMRDTTDGLFDTLVEKGENLESKAIVLAKGAQITATETLAASTTKVRNVLPTASNDRVEELEAELMVLNKKLAAMAKKQAAAKKVKVKTEKTPKAETQNTAPKTELETESSQAA